jgi:glycosyltransferase involved in cell wall biosynthesis
MTSKNVLVVASTFPASATDPVPAFVRDQITAFKKVYPDMTFSVLAPHDARSHTKSFTGHEAYNEYRVHYFWPFRAEKLAGRGIVPALKQNPFNYLLVPFLFACEFFALWRLCRKLRPDVIYAHWFTPQGITAGMVSSLTKVPFVYTSHSSDVAFLRKIPLIGPKMVRHFSGKARAITVVSRRSLEKLRAFFADSDWQKLERKIAVIPMGVDLTVSLEKTNTAHQNNSNILFLGRLAEKKGVQYLLPAFANVYRQFPYAQLVIAGDGPWLEQLKTLVGDLGLTDKVQFSGYVSGQQKTDAIVSSDIYVVPSIITASGDAEGLPVSLMEGLAAGKVCIATNESGADDIIDDGKDGFLVPQKDAQALEEALTKALELTAEKRGALQTAARKTAEQFEWTTIAKQHHRHLFE